MACMKLGSEAQVFRREGQAWLCNSGLPSDVKVEVGEMCFHLHQFPLMSKSGVMERLIREASAEGSEGCCVIQIPQIPGSAKTFEIIAKFCYGTKFELTAANIVHVRVAAELLEMTENFGEGNLIVQTENFLNQVVLKNRNDSILALQTCNDILPIADELHIVKRCIESVVIKTSMDPNLFGGRLAEDRSMPSPGGSLLWNGITAGPKKASSIPVGWYEDVSCLSLPIYKRLISAMGYRGIGEEIIASCLASYAKRHLPGLTRLRASKEPSNYNVLTPSDTVASEQDQKLVLEEICGLLPIQKGLVPTKLLFGLLRSAMILQASPSCMSTLERFIGLQLDEASLEDLLIPSYSHSVESLYNIDSVQRILEHFLSVEDQDTAGSSPYSADGERLYDSPSLQPLTAVARLMDNFLAEIAEDVNLKPPKFEALIASVPDYARPLGDGLYHAIDTYLKAHPWVDDADREQLCRYIDCQKLSVQACTHAARNERLPMRIIVQVLFFEQLQLKSSVASCFLVSDNLEASRACRRENAATAVYGGEWVESEGDNQEMRLDMERMRARVNELEKECSNMRQKIKKMGKMKSQWNVLSGRFSSVKFQVCSAQKGAVVDRRSLNRKAEKLKARAEDVDFHLAS